MKQISNKTLTFLLIAAIVVSVGGTIISVNRITRLTQEQALLITGMAGTGSGYVNVSIASVASVSILEGQIDFGSCTPNATIGANVSSNDSAAWGSPGVCTVAGSAVVSADNITIKNDGNTFINITVSTNMLAATLIGGDEPWPPEFWFMVRNASSASTYGPGCFNRTGDGGTCAASVGTGGLQWDWKNFSDTTGNDAHFCACDNLTYTSGTNAIYLFARLGLPANALQQGEKEATLTLTATEI